MTPTVETSPLLDLDRYLWKRSMGNITAIGTWSLHNGRPVMVLVPTFARPTHERIQPCLVPMDLAYLWDEHTGDPGHCAQASYGFANALGLNPLNPHDLIRLTSIIREHLGDLLMMPNMPSSEKQVVADAILTNPNTGKTREAEIIDYV